MTSRRLSPGLRITASRSIASDKNSAAARVAAGEKAKSAKSEIWLPFLNAYRTMCIAPSPDFLQALEGISTLRRAASLLDRGVGRLESDVKRT
jgi:hypothetical protein